MKNFETLIIEAKGPCLWVTINRSSVLNALNKKVLLELSEVFSEKSVWLKEIRAVVIQGAGEKSFVAGADISEMSGMNQKEAEDFSKLGQQLTRSIEKSPCLTIAKVQGFALGGGCELAMACDLIIASKRAKFGQPEVSLGLVPGFGGTQRLVRRVGLSIALDILCTGRFLNGDEAYQFGLASRVTSSEELDNEIAKVLSGIYRAGPLANAATKRLAQSATDFNLDSGLEAESLAFSKCMVNGEGHEGMKAFLEKRPAPFIVEE